MTDSSRITRYTGGMLKSRKIETEETSGCPEDHARGLERARPFEWDEKKRTSNCKNTESTFFHVARIFGHEITVIKSDHRSEKRYITSGPVAGEVVTAVCTIREDRCRWISARRASRNERQEYHGRFQTRSAKR